MTNSTVSLFLNPAAGRGRAARCMPRIEQLFRDAEVPVDIIQSCAVGDLEKKVATQVNKGVRNIVVAGGDGSVHEAVNGVMRANAPASLGVIPIGTGNDFAKACDIPLDWDLAGRMLVARIVANDSTRALDIGRMNDRFFANGAGIGFDAKVTRIARSIDWPIGDLVYLFAILRCLYDGVATSKVRIESDHTVWDGPLTLANVSNGPWVGGMFHIAPMANNNDGELDLLIAAPVSRLRVLSLLPDLIRGRHLGASEIAHHAVRSLRISSSTPIESHLDGEVQELQTDFEIEVLPGALNLL